MSQEAPSPLAPGTLVYTRYQVIAAVGRGGLGTVYQVRDMHDGAGNIYALKEQWDQSPSARKQFMREGGWLKALDHPSIPKVHEYFEWNERLYLLMDFVAGENLEERLERAGRPLPEPQVLGWIMPVCDALHYLHTRTPPLIHRDVKPSNIIVTAGGHPVLVDLGIAKEHAPGANRTATFVRKAGTEGYAPPEQYAASGRAGPWSDIYSLGATLYQLLTGEIPPTAVERAALDHRLPPPRAINPAISLATDSALQRALAIRPRDRYQTMPEFKRALAMALQAPTTGSLSPFAIPSGTPSPFAGSGPPPAANTPLARPPGAPSPRPTSPAPAPPPIARPAPSGPGLGRAARPAVLARPRPPAPALGRSRPSMPDAPSSPPSTPASPLRPAIWGVALAAILLAIVAAGVVFLHNLTPPDRSTAAVSVEGYFAALRDQDYARAWQYTELSVQGGESQTDFVAGLKADDTRYGRVLSFTIGSIQVDTTGHASTTVLVVRATTSGVPMQYDAVLGQYGSLWLVDSVSSA